MVRCKQEAKWIELEDFEHIVHTVWEDVNELQEDEIENAYNVSLTMKYGNDIKLEDFKEKGIELDNDTRYIFRVSRTTKTGRKKYFLGLIKNGYDCHKLHYVIDFKQKYSRLSPQGGSWSLEDIIKRIEKDGYFELINLVEI